MRDQSSQWVSWSTICLRTSQSKISAPPPVSDSRPASMSSSRICVGRQPGDRLEEVDLGGGEALERDVGQRGLELAQHARVVLPRQRRVQAVDDVQFGEPVVLHRQRLLDGLLDAHRVRVLLAGLALEAAVGAGRGADVGQVEVAVDVEERRRRSSPCARCAPARRARPGRRSRRGPRRPARVSRSPAAIFSVSSSLRTSSTPCRQCTWTPGPPCPAVTCYLSSGATRGGAKHRVDGANLPSLT